MKVVAFPSIDEDVECPSCMTNVQLHDMFRYKCGEMLCTRLTNVESSESIK